MQTRSTLLLALVSVSSLLPGLSAVAQDAGKTEARLTFLNGDSISGEIKTWNDGRISILNPKIKQDLNLKTTNLLKIDLKKPGFQPEPGKKTNHEAIITLQHRFGSEQAHDQLKGQLVQITDDAITLNTDYAGEVVIDRKFIVNMDISSNNANIYAGPNNLEEWYQPDSDNSWNFKNSSLISGGTVGGQLSKDIGLEDLCYMSFFMDWKQSPNIKLLLFSDDFETSRPDNYYEMVIRNNYLYMRKFTSEDGSDPMDGSTSIRQLTGMDTAFVEIFMNKKKGTFDILMDGEIVASISDRNATPERFGSSLHFVSEPRSPVRLRDLRVSRWSGRLPSKDDESAFEKLKGEGQRILLKNGDAIIGKLGKVDNGVLKVETKYTPIPIPVSGMRSIYMKTAEKNQPKQEIGDVKAYFTHGGWVIMKLVSLDPDKLVGYHQAFGEKAFNLDAFSQIEFNIYDPNMNAVRIGPSW